MFASRTVMAAELFRGEGAELGVAAGDFSRAIITKSRCFRLWSIDRWSDHHDLAEYKRAATTLAEVAQGRCIPLRMTFSEAAALFHDASLDFIYIDGYAHTGQDGGKTLEEWWPKLKPGGIFSGHDYHPDFPLTIDAVDSFIEQHGLTMELTGEVKYPSWWTTKPNA